MALVCYTVAIAAHQRERRVSAAVIRFLYLGLLLDVVATGCMIMGSQAKGLTAHAVLGFSATTGMLLQTAIAW